jgi:hypothetical protein
MKIKYTISLCILLALLSCSKIPFFKNDQTSNKEVELQKKEQELKEKEQSLKDKEQRQIEEDKEKLEQKEEELKQKEREISEKNNVRATYPPSDIPTKFIEYINNYVTSNDERYLKRAYNLWNDPMNTIGSYDKFSGGFLNTLDDKIISVETLNNDGFISEVSVIHIAREYNKNWTNEYNKYQKSTYKSKYTLASLNGQWKIIHAKANMTNREYN